MHTSGLEYFVINVANTIYNKINKKNVIDKKSHFLLLKTIVNIGMTEGMGNLTKISVLMRIPVNIWRELIGRK